VGHQSESDIVDTSIWIHHFRSRNEVLVALMENDLALTHPMVVAELACGSLDGSRIQTLSNIENLNSSTNVSLLRFVSSLSLRSYTNLAAA
jgi:predicted nucleic acid-binding protein